MKSKLFIKTKDACKGVIAYAQKNMSILFVALFLLVFCAVSLIFFIYGYRAINYTAKPSPSKLKIDTDLLGKINAKFAENEKLFKDSAFSTIPDPFKQE
jgi:hypothetical protein